MWLDGREIIMTDEMRADGNEPATKADLRAFATKEDLKALATKGELGALRGDFQTFREEILGEFKSFRAEMRDMIRPVTITLANHTAELADIRGYMKEHLVTRSEFHARMDGFTGRVDDYDYSALEGKRS